MKPAPFEYIAPDTVEEALAAKASAGDEAKFLAGGQSLMPAMNLRLVRPSMLIDLNRLVTMDRLETDGDDVLRIGALVRYARLESDPGVRLHHPLVCDALKHVAHPQIRNRGTLCGNLAHADPASEMPAVMLALGASLCLNSSQGSRTVAAAEFFRGVFSTALREDEMLAEVRLPAPPRFHGTSFAEVARRRGDFAMMGVAAFVALEPDGRCGQARIALCNAGTTALLSATAANALLGSRGLEAVEHAAALIQSDIDPLGSLHASREYQRHLAGVLARRVIADAMGKAGAALHA